MRAGRGRRWWSCGSRAGGDGSGGGEVGAANDVVLAIDVGKTSLRAAVFAGQGELGLGAVVRIAAARPEQAVRELLREVERVCRERSVRAVGMSLFGPLETDPASPNFGAIGESSEAAWSGVSLPRLVGERVGRPVFFDYDVNAGALAEARMGAGVGVGRFLYLSVGTGIGGAWWDGGLRFGFSPQLGHVFVPREADDLGFRGSCRMHDGCLQGLASGKALGMRWGVAAEALPAQHPGWDLEARYLARACTNFLYTRLPERVLLASSVAMGPGLVERINGYVGQFVNGFLDPGSLARMEARPLVQMAGLVPESSLLGAAMLAREELGLRLGERGR